MIDGDGFGMNWPGQYDPELMDYYRQGRREHANPFAGDRQDDDLRGAPRHGQPRRPVLRGSQSGARTAAAYDEALTSFDVLVLPTLPITATPIPAPTVSREESTARSTEMIVNTAPFDVTGHPATTVPAGLVDGLPAGLMIVGRQLGDATCLRVAHAYEAAVGGFPAPADGLAARASGVPPVS